MINFLGCSTQGIAVANDVTAVALLERMVERKVLTRADVRIILRSGIECLEPRINVRSVAEAVRGIKCCRCSPNSYRGRRPVRDPVEL